MFYKHLSYKIRLFVVKLLKIATPQEEEEIKTLLQNKTDYQRLLNELSDPREYILRQEFLRNIDTEKELKDFIGRHPVLKRRALRSYWWVAAILTPLVIGAAVSLHILSQPSVPGRNMHTTAILPGTQGATLTLSDGSLQILTHDFQPITEINGTQIHSDSNRLNYAVNNTVAHDTHPIYNHLVVGRGLEYMLILQDGTKVWLNSESEIYYPVQFTASSREVRLQGEAYFEVARDTSRPFVVKVNNHFEVKVLGTYFNIKAYPSDDQAETTLLEGKVAVSAIATNETTVLSPSQQMILRKNGEHLVRKVNPEYAIAWHNGWFYFENETLEKALEQIGRWYNIDFIFENRECKDIRVSGKVKRFENIQMILNMLKTTTKCDYLIKNQKIHVTKNNRK